MYNGLFGDLPSAKKDSGSILNDDENSKEESMVKLQSKKNNKEEPSSTSNIFLPGNSIKDTVTPTFVPRFMPQQMKRPRKNHVVASKKPQSKQERKKKETTPGTEVSSPQVKHDENPNPNDNLASSQNVQSGFIQVLAASGNRGNFINDDEEQFSISTEQPSATIIEREPDYLSELHELAKNDLYDPMLPNDLLHYWEHQRATKERDRLMHERDLALREHERMRQELDAERQRLQAEGDLDRIVQHRMEHQQGRKVSNVPAWLIEQQRVQREAANNGGAITE